MSVFSVNDVTPWPQDYEEPASTSGGVWVLDPEGDHWLLKRPRLQTGEDWAEKIAAEVAGFLGLPHAQVELGTVNNNPAILVRRFIELRRYTQLTHGNELLSEHDPSYPSETNTVRLPQHTLDRILNALNDPSIEVPAGLGLPSNVESSVDLFIGYLLLDAWIANTDRHHKNWGVLTIYSKDGSSFRRELAPTFDHASSLGRELSDAEREERLTTKDKNRTVAAYATSGKARSRIYGTESERYGLHPIETFRLAAQQHPEAARAWLQRLADVPDAQVEAVVQAVPDARMSLVGRQFALGLLSCNRGHLMKLSSP